MIRGAAALIAAFFAVATVVASLSGADSIALLALTLGVITYLVGRRQAKGHRS